MMRSQIFALLGGSSIALLAGLAWHAYAPSETPAKQLPLMTIDTPQQAEAPREALPSSKPLASPPPAETAMLRPETAIQRPEFDVVRVEPSGESVIAGHSRPDAKVTLMAGNKVLAETSADSSGNFVVTPALPPGDFQLSLRDGSAALDSVQSVTVSIPHKPGDKVIVALAEPGKSTIVLTTPQSPAQSREPKDPQRAVAFTTAEVDKKGFYASGTAQPGAHLRIYADGKPLADVTVDPAGRWSLRVANHLNAKRHELRADSLDAAGKVVARAEIPFDITTGLLEAKAEPADAAAAKPDPALAGPGAAKVRRGDNLWQISRKLLGDGVRYTQIYEANSQQIRNPNLIYPGQVFVVPQAGK
jgi:nucleoid-associated protein YgaU